MHLFVILNTSELNVWLTIMVDESWVMFDVNSKEEYERVDKAWSRHE